MRLIARIVLSGTNYSVRPGSEFEVGADEAAQLISAGAAYKAPKRVERAVEDPAVEKAVEEVEVVNPDVQQRVTAPASVDKPSPPKPRKRKGKKVSK